MLCNKLLLLLLLLPIVSSPAQQPTAPPEGSNWQHVQALPIGATVHLNAGKRHQSCTIRSVDADSLTCTKGKNPVYQRVEVTSIQLNRRGRSVLIGAGIGAGVGAIVGAATGGCSQAEKQSWFGCFLTPTKPQGAAIAGTVLGGIGSLIGLTDFSRSTVYRTP
jgi:hypothetical protein